MVKRLTLFFVAIFFILSLAMDVGAEEELRNGAQEGPGLLKKIEKLEKDIGELKKEAEARRKEAEARERLEVTEEEKAEKEKEVLSAAGRRYTLGKKGMMGVEYNFGYSYYTTDRLEFGEAGLDVQHQKVHSLTHTIVADYAFLDNLTATGSLPFVYKYENVGASESKDVSDVGDISLGLRWQPFKIGGKWPTTILSAGISTDTGQSPYDINIGDELSTGSGFWSCSAGASLSKTIDPVVAFGSLSYSHNFDASDLNQHHGTLLLKKVEPGDSIGFSMGIGYALSYDVSLTMGFSQSYGFETEYYYKGGITRKSAASTTSSFSIGTGWRINPKTTIFINVGTGLTDDASDFFLSFRLPFDFEL